MNPILKGKWLSDKIQPAHGRGYYAREVMLKIVSITEVKIAFCDKAKWLIHPYSFEVVGNQIQCNGEVYFAFTGVTDNNNVELYSPAKRCTYYMLRVPKP